jgi:hypothetical protein
MFAHSFFLPCEAEALLVTPLQLLTVCVPLLCQAARIASTDRNNMTQEFVIYQQGGRLTRHGHGCYKQQFRPRGPMDKAPAYGAGDCRFDPGRGYFDVPYPTLFVSFCCPRRFGNTWIWLGYFFLPAVLSTHIIYIYIYTYIYIYIYR